MERKKSTKIYFIITCSIIKSNDSDILKCVSDFYSIRHARDFWQDVNFFIRKIEAYQEGEIASII